MRLACSCMMSRKRARASGSSRAGPCSVSMKPASEASGVRSSWLALATKSTRTRSVRRRSLRSSRVRTTNSPSGRVAEPRLANQAANQRSVGMRSANSTRSGPPPWATRSKAATRSGIAQAKGQRFAGTDGEGGDGALVGVVDDAAAVEDETGVGQRVGEGAHTALGGCPRRGRGGRAFHRAGARQQGDKRRDDDKNDAGRRERDRAGDRHGSKQCGHGRNQPAALGKPDEDAGDEQVCSPAFRTGDNHSGDSRS